MTGGPEILDLVHDSIIVRALDGTILQWNAAAETQYGWTRPEALGRPFAELLPCEPVELLQKIEAELSAAGAWNGELVRRDRQGRELRIEVRWSIRRGEDDTPREIVETGRDVTEQARQRGSGAAKRLSLPEPLRGDGRVVLGDRLQWSRRDPGTAARPGHPRPARLPAGASEAAGGNAAHDAGDRRQYQDPRDVRRRQQGRNRRPSHRALLAAGEPACLRRFPHRDAGTAAPFHSRDGVDRSPRPSARRHLHGDLVAGHAQTRRGHAGGDRHHRSSAGGTQAAADPGRLHPRGARRHAGRADGVDRA